MRSVISTLQDLGFVLDKADKELGTVSATRFVLNQPLKMSVVVREKNETQLQIRANAQYNFSSIEEPEIYQDFFRALSGSMFIERNEVGNLDKRLTWVLTPSSLKNRKWSMELTIFAEFGQCHLPNSVFCEKQSIVYTMMEVLF